MKREKERISQIFENKCIGCELCVDLCPSNVLGMTYYDNREYASIVYPERCTGCGYCQAICDFDAVELTDIYA